MRFPLLAVAALACLLLGAAALAALAIDLDGSDGEPRRARPPASVDALARAVSDAVPPAMREGHVPGAAVAIARRDGVAWVRGFGVASAGGAPVDAGTLFQAASLSKPVTAWGVVASRALPLDAPVFGLLRPWPLPRSSFDARAITPRRLLSHTAGLSVDGYLGHDPERPLPSTAASLRGDSGGVGAVRQVARPGSGYRYSGGGYTLLQAAIEARTGGPFDAWARRAILRPLRMRDSSFGWPPRVRSGARPAARDGRRAVADQAASRGDADPSAAAVATGHDAAGRPVPGYRYAELAAAGLATSARDLGRFAQALLGPIGARLGAPQPATDGEYGLGLHVERLADGTTLLSHEGVNRGWHARLLALRSEDRAIAVLTNGDGGQRVADAVERLLVR